MKEKKKRKQHLTTNARQWSCLFYRIIFTCAT